MNKSTQKRKKYNVEVLESTAKKFKVSERYVRKCLEPGAQNSEKGDEIKKHYRSTVSQITEILK